MSTDRFRAIMKALALGDSDTAKRLSVDFDADEHAALYVYGTAVMAICLEERFKDDASVEAVHKFVNEMRHDFRNSQPPIKPLMIEAYIRAFCGEDHLMDEVPETERADAQVPIIRKIVGQSPALQDRLDQVLEEATVLAEEWAAED